MPSLCMVDDILAIQECSKDSVQMNSVINSFIELKKLTLSSKKCSKIHVGKVSASCPELKVHEMKMKNSEKEKYLGDQLSSSAKIKETIDERVAKGYGVVSEILAILDEIPLGKYKLEIGLKLRQAMLLNGVLYNSEAWHAVKKDDIKPLERVDECLLRSLLQSHPKTPIEFLYLETGSISISHIIASRRMMYLRTILCREDEELTKRIYREQEKNTTKGDFAELVKDNFKKYKIQYDEASIVSMKYEQYKDIIKKKVKETAFNELKTKQESHSKVNKIVYNSLVKQPYLVSPIFTNEDVEVLVNLRSHTTRGIRTNFKQLYKNDLSCPLVCWPADGTHVQDSQQHLLVCEKLELNKSTVATEKIVIDDIYGTVNQQKAVATAIKELLSERNRLLEKMPTSGCNHWTLAPQGAVQAQLNTVNNNCGVCFGT